MRTSILATTAAIGMAIAAPAQAQQSTAPGQQQIQSDKQMQEEANKGIKTRDSGESGFVGQHESSGASAHPPGRPIRAAARRRVRAPVQLAARVPRLAARHASVLPVRVRTASF
jgi:hypothetical protein